MRRAGLDVADEAAVRLDREVQEASVLEGGRSLDLPAQTFAPEIAQGRKGRGIVVVRGDEVVNVVALERPQPDAVLGRLAHVVSLTRAER